MKKILSASENYQVLIKKLKSLNYYVLKCLESLTQTDFIFKNSWGEKIYVRLSFNKLRFLTNVMIEEI